MSLVKFNLFFLILIICNEYVKCYKTIEDESIYSQSFSKWFDGAQKDVIKKLKTMELNRNEAKNVIIFLGDGMSIPTITAARIHLEQRNLKDKENKVFELDEFPHSGLSMTYCVDKQVADSACSATAYLGGVKANFQTIGVTSDVKLHDCIGAANKKNQVSSIAEWAQNAKKLTGIVTTTRVTHASPAGNYGHISHRNMESDFDINKSSMKIKEGFESCRDLAQQLIYDLPGKNFNVILGGGRDKFLSNSTLTNKIDSYGSGERLDGKNLIKAWHKNKKNTKYVTNRKELLNVDYKKTDYLLGLFTESHMKFNLDNVDQNEPSLAEMTSAAIRLLQKSKNGFYLFVEGGLIDIAHHQTKTRKALDETIEFTKAIKIAKELTSEKDTLIVVTADHSHTMSISGYSTIETDILGLNTQKSQIDKLPYATLSYANGESSKRSSNGMRLNLTMDDFSDKEYQYPSNVPMTAETHGGDDVAVFASGPWSHLFSGVYEENLIPHLMAYSACIGKGHTSCDDIKKIRRLQIRKKSTYF